uniref:Uncharacterized protein n=1 Tax=Anguilla anguilla TaxID=7936 RepID=A0A0E9S016_ANGAN
MRNSERQNPIASCSPSHPNNKENIPAMFFFIFSCFFSDLKAFF